MKKIKTIFDRDWDGTKQVIDKYVEGFSPDVLIDAKATEKVDGTNVRLTIRNHTIVRVEKRCNPSKIQKYNGIEDPWYIDASESKRSSSPSAAMSPTESRGEGQIEARPWMIFVKC